MSLPLATLQRRSRTVWLQDRFSTLPRERGPALAFARADEACAYLRFWQTEPAALSALRYALYRCEHSPSVFALSDPQVLQSLSAKLAHGALMITESSAPTGTGGWPLLPAAAPPVAPASSTLIRLGALPDKPPAPPLLPVLEEVQIEGAEVLPEIEQTLEQISLSLGSIDLAGVSLKPTPSRVPLIETEMSKASQSINQTLDEL